MTNNNEKNLDLENDTKELDNEVVDEADELIEESNDVDDELVEEVIKEKTEGDTINEDNQKVIIPENARSDDGTPITPNITVDVSEAEPSEEASNEKAEDSWTFKDQTPYEELPKDDLLDKYYKAAINALLPLDELPWGDFYLNTCNSGTNRFYLKNITETKYFDEVWIRTLEGLVPSIDKIIRNPKLSIRYEQEVVAIEKAKKTTADSVRHLASHTQLIREVKADGTVMPKKILTTYAEEEIATYENRFIMTLIKRLFQFVSIRHETISQNVKSFQNDHMFYVSNFPIKDEEVELKLDIRVKRDLDNENINKHNMELLARVDNLMTQVSGFRNSPFMLALKKAKNVHPPIMKTNVILKNADFRNAYTLWLFLDKYSSLGFDINVRERPVRLSRVFKANLDRISALAYSGLINNKKRRQEDFTSLELVEPIVKKSTKMAKTNVLDIIKKPDEINIEDNNVNEYYLELNKKVVNKKIKDLVEENYSEVSAVKKVVKESIDITNSMFDSIFNVEENIGYFEKFIFEENPEQSYKDAKNKVKFARILREAKEVDYRKTLKLEKSLYGTMKKANNARIKYLQESKKKPEFEAFQANIEKELANKLKERKRLNDLIKGIDDKIILIEQEKEAFEAELVELQKQMEAEVSEITAKAKADVKAELQALKDKHQALINKNEDEFIKKFNEKQNELDEKIEWAKMLREERMENFKKKKAELIAKAKEAAKKKKQEALDKEKEKQRIEKEKQKETFKEKLAKQKNKADELLKKINSK